MNPPPLREPNEFIDRKTGLVVFGVFTTLLGVLCALFIPLIFFGQAMATKAGAPPKNAGLWPAVLVYGTLAVSLVWLGIGSMMSRRWARALLLIFSSTWLTIGVISVVIIAVLMPRIVESIHSTKQPGQPEVPSLFLLIPMVMIGFIYLVLPTVWLLFYRSRHVKATCEAYDPVVRWTDRAPLPVIAASMWLAFSAPMMAVLAFAYNGVVPAFGNFVVGPLGSAIYLLFGLALGYSAWAIYKLDLRGWWVVVICFGLWAVSSFATYSRHDLKELYALMGYSGEQITQMSAFLPTSPQVASWAAFGALVPMLGYFLYIRRFFPRAGYQPAANVETR